MSSFTLPEIVKGKWTSAFEKKFDENLAHYKPSLNFWNLMSYKAFKEGQEGVLIGDDGWLFTTEEFDKPEGYSENIKTNLNYIYDVSKTLDEQSVKLLILPIPAKARVLEGQLGRYEFPAHRQPLYKAFLSGLKKNNIVVVDLYRHVKKFDNFFLKTDTHWTPEGARLAASRVAINAMLNGFDGSEHRVGAKIESESVTTHEGDLMRYTVSGDTAKSVGLQMDTLNTYKATITGNNADDLFADTYIPVVLVGTSYSANKNWPFDVFLKESLQTDVLNMADEGLGPFETMQKYLKSTSYKQTKPKLVVWEIPERFLPVKYDLQTKDE